MQILQVKIPEWVAIPLVFPHSGIEPTSLAASLYCRWVLTTGLEQKPHTQHILNNKEYDFVQTIVFRKSGWLLIFDDFMKCLFLKSLLHLSHLMIK